MVRLGWRCAERKMQRVNKARQSRNGSCKGAQAPPKDLWGMNHVQGQHEHLSLMVGW